MPGAEENCRVSEVRKVASEHEAANGEAKTGLVSELGGVRHAAPTERSVVAALPEVGSAVTVSPVMSAPSVGAPVLSKNTKRTECAAASL